MISLRIRDILQRVFLKPQASAPTQATGIADIYVKTDKSLYYRDTDGSEQTISGSVVTEAPTFNATTSFTLNGTNINTSNTLDNIAYLDYANVYDNDLWQYAEDGNGDATAVWKMTTAGRIAMGEVEIGSLLIDPDTGRATLANQDVTSDSAYGQGIGLKLAIAGKGLEVYAQADGAGGVINQTVIVEIPTSDPGISGALWNDSGTVKIST